MIYNSHVRTCRDSKTWGRPITIGDLLLCLLWFMDFMLWEGGVFMIVIQGKVTRGEKSVPSLQDTYNVHNKIEIGIRQ